MEAPPGFELRAVEVEPGGHRIYHVAEWRDSLVALARGEIELECVDGERRSLERGDIFWLADLPLRALHNPGDRPALLLAVSRAQPDR
jgi:quercetin dioxygenase-like cupin family protein